MNTLLCYFYRDAENYKTFNDVVISGALHLKDLQPYLKDETFFIPSEVGLCDLQGDKWTAEDHIWHEIESVQLTEDMVTLDIWGEQLLEKFKTAHQNEWNEYAVFKRKGLL